MHLDPMCVIARGIYTSTCIRYLQILSRPQTQVVAAARPVDDCSELHALSALHKNRIMIVPLELSDPDTVQVYFDFASRSRNCS